MELDGALRNFVGGQVLNVPRLPLEDLISSLRYIFDPCWSPPLDVEVSQSFRKKAIRPFMSAAMRLYLLCCELTMYVSGYSHGRKIRYLYMQVRFFHVYGRGRNILGDQGSRNRLSLNQIRTWAPILMFTLILMRYGIKKKVWGIEKKVISSFSGPDLGFGGPGGTRVTWCH